MWKEYIYISNVLFVVQCPTTINNMQIVFAISMYAILSRFTIFEFRLQLLKKLILSTLVDTL